MQFEPLTTLPLAHDGDCSLLGVTPDLTIYAEEIYGDDGWLAQRAVTMNGIVRAEIDEDYGRRETVEPLPLPAQLAVPKRVWHAMRLNFSGARLRGLREADRVSETTQSLTPADKFALAAAAKLPVPAPMILGIVESYVLAEALIASPDVFFVCRRVRVAYALPEPARDTDGQPYDYDSTALYLAHLYQPSAERDLTLEEALRPLAGAAALHRPMDCLAAYGLLFIADGGSDGMRSAIHVWRLPEQPSTPSPEERLLKKIYG